MRERAVHLGILVLDLFLPFSSSLKDKRQVIRSITDRARSRHSVSTAEVGFQDLLQRASIAFAVVASTPTVINKIFDAVLDDVEREVPGSVSFVEREILE